MFLNEAAGLFRRCNPLPQWKEARHGFYLDRRSGLFIAVIVETILVIPKDCIDDPRWAVRMFLIGRLIAPVFPACRQ